MLVDTDIFVDFLREYREGLNFIEKHEINIEITEFTKLELIIGCRNNNEIKSIEEFLNRFKLLKINSDIIEKSVELLKKHYLKDGTDLIDSIIASTAIFYNIDFYTKNIKHYKNIKGLKLKKAY